VTISPTVTTFRDAYLALVPRWMKGTRLGAVGYAIATHLDLVADSATYAVKARFPGYSTTTDTLLGKERRIVRGYDEPVLAYRARLPYWLDVARRRANAWLVLETLRAYFTEHSVTLEYVANTGATTARVKRLLPDGTMENDSISWDWDGQGVALPSRFWLVLHVDADVAEICPTWGDGGWEATGVVSETIGSTAPYWMVQNVRAIVQDCNSASGLCSHIILVFADYEAEWAAQQPDGTWGRLGNRNPYACYWKGTES
jgi:hypothetical protein